MSGFEKSTYVTKWLSTKNLCVLWAQSQQSFDQAHAQRIADNIDPDMFGVISVTLPNKDGIHHIIDGQHRVAAVRIAWGDDQKVPCNIFQVTEPEVAAKIFDAMQTNKKNPSPVDRFLIRVTAGRETEVVVHGILTRAGYTVSVSQTNGSIRCVSACVSVYKSKGGVALINAINVIQKTWGNDVHATEGSMIRGFTSFMADHGDKIDKNKMAAKLRKKYFEPTRLLIEAKQAKEMFNGSTTTNMNNLLLAAYNHGLRNKLEPRKAAA